MAVNGLAYKAAELKARGLTQTQIAGKLGVTQQSVSKMLRNSKRLIEEEMGEERIEKAKESTERFDVIAVTEELVQLHTSVVRDDPLNRGIAAMAYTGIKLLAQLRGELVEKRETRNENREVKDIDEALFISLCERYLDNSGGNSSG